jgi:hypothetical protein
MPLPATGSRHPRCMASSPVSDTVAGPNNGKVGYMGKLTAKARKALPPKDFAGPDESYPDEDPAHARDALSRVSANGAPAVKAQVRKNVAKKYPNMKVARLRKGGLISDRMHAKKTAKYDSVDGDRNRG